MEITLLGTGDTTGTPMVGCTCATCDRARTLGIERSRFSVHVRNEETDESLLIDASPDFRYQFLTNDVSLPDEILITHIHFDHLDGLGNLFRLCRDVPVYASSVVDETTGESVAETIHGRYEYLDAVTVRPVEPGVSFESCGLTFELCPVNHPPFESFGVVIADPTSGGRLGLTGDTCYDIPKQTKKSLYGVDLLLADAIVHAPFCEDHPAGGQHYDDDGVARTFGTKHMTREGALSLAEELDVERVRLVHASHYYPPEEAFREPLAVDGERYEL